METVKSLTVKVLGLTSDLRELRELVLLAIQRQREQIEVINRQTLAINQLIEEADKSGPTEPAAAWAIQHLSLNPSPRRI